MDKKWEVIVFDDKGDIVMKRRPLTKMLPQTIKQFTDRGLRAEVKQYRESLK